MKNAGDAVKIDARAALATEHNTPPQWYAGLMTGTVLDGNIDVAFLRTDGVDIFECGGYALIPYPQDIRDLIAGELTRQGHGISPGRNRIFSPSLKRVYRWRRQMLWHSWPTVRVCPCLRLPRSAFTDRPSSTVRQRLTAMDAPDSLAMAG